MNKTHKQFFNWLQLMFHYEFLRRRNVVEFLHNLTIIDKINCGEYGNFIPTVGYSSVIHRTEKEICNISFQETEFNVQLYYNNDLKYNHICGYENVLGDYNKITKYKEHILFILYNKQQRIIKNNIKYPTNYKSVFFLIIPQDNTSYLFNNYDCHYDTSFKEIFQYVDVQPYKSLSKEKCGTLFY